ncbi:sugar phosphate nucleotidyltransferase [Halobellus inordinatus]|uniref:sugar phosphate nucleotidyltransferase n=1 Tax=Halobellus inordinatus TaxID=1126236 RepID=UPI00211429D3|nr:sugar phosphate nucleotidyltransferase [Halobellus ramosii]
MKAIIPAAGQGTRLYPHTHTKPKAMVRIAGKPILGHILDRIEQTTVDEVVVVVGKDMQDQIVSYATDNYSDVFDFEFPIQNRALGLGHSIYQAEEHVRGDEILITLGDMLFESDYSDFIAASDADTAGAIGIKQVDEPSHYGIVDRDERGEITRLIEKPDDPPSYDAISGVYIVNDTSRLFAALEYLIENDIRGAGDEYQLTDALQRMVESGASLTTFEVKEWYDCGRPKTLLEANRVLLSNKDAPTESTPTGDGAVIAPPVDIGKNASLENCIVGPYVSIDGDATIENTIVQNCIVGLNTELRDANIEGSLIGDNAEVVGAPTQLNIGDNSSLEL